MKKKILILAVIGIALLMSSCGAKLEENPLFKAALLAGPVKISDKALLEKPLTEWSEEQLSMVFNNIHPSVFYAGGDFSNRGSGAWDFYDFSDGEKTLYRWQEEQPVMGRNETKMVDRSGSFKEIELYLYQNYNITSYSFPKFGLAMYWGIVDQKPVCTLGTLKANGGLDSTSLIFASLYISQAIFMEDGIMTIEFNNSNKVPGEPASLPSIKIVVNTELMENDNGWKYFEMSVYLDDKFSNTGALRIDRPGNASVNSKWMHFTLSEVEDTLKWEDETDPDLENAINSIQ